mmetsp:Transcript_88579/g.277381  ORF Transcript_88579/g.277381 Transcript_88579/m.277381 type:complete len:221 (+) Transcript_88579:485-1147(+)
MVDPNGQGLVERPHGGLIANVEPNRPLALSAAAGLNDRSVPTLPQLPHKLSPDVSGATNDQHHLRRALTRRRRRRCRRRDQRGGGGDRSRFRRRRRKLHGGAQHGLTLGQEVEPEGRLAHRGAGGRDRVRPEPGDVVVVALVVLKVKLGQAVKFNVVLHRRSAGQLRLPVVTDGAKDNLLQMRVGHQVMIMDVKEPLVILLLRQRLADVIGKQANNALAA